MNQTALCCYGVKILFFLSSYLGPVQFTDVPQNITVNRSTPLFLNCDATGFPEPKIKWEKSGITLFETKQLNISNSKRNDAGEYVCIASNGVRQEKTARAYVTVQCKLFFFSMSLKAATADEFIKQSNLHYSTWILVSV